MTVSAFRKASKSLTDRTVNFLYVMSAAMVMIFSLFPPVMVFFDGASFSNIMMISFILMMYVFSHMALTERYPAFCGAEAVKSKKGMSFGNMQCRTAVYQLPAGRETIVRSYIGMENLTAGFSFLSSVLSGAVLIIHPTEAIFSAAAFVMYIVMSAIILGLSNTLRSCDSEKSTQSVTISYYIAIVFIWLYFLFWERLDGIMESGVMHSDFPSWIFGALCIILGIADFIILSRIHTELIRDCPNRSVSGELISNERNEENV